MVAAPRAVLLGVGAVLALTTTGCGALGFGGSGVDRDRVAERTGQVLQERLGRTPDEVTCAEDLPAEVEASIDCEVTHDGDTYPVTVTTTSVDGSDVEFEVEVDGEPRE
ncbi:uncharacterized protein DUF4333 [Haloactinospora alba]|uniref:Uncharacterized protein DUF4333 n=1 Tax=Haloactinospora alba TaxID=405555 RepID=A0A543N7N8_9ACTN|nr:DUF4333 domain-containing protein [Haloactinospora alba]TQN27846.1 uncharacterized protein DUF4333 [Haloactinospora alba]